MIGFVDFNVGAYVHPVCRIQAATYDLNIELHDTNFLFSLLVEPPFSFSIPGLLLADLFSAPVISTYGALDLPLEKKMNKFG
jgi:hypothetical protein